MRILRNTIVCFLVLQLALPSAVGHAIAFVPSFLAHYEHHAEEHHAIGFLEFVEEHFTGDSEHHADSEHPEHNDCPVSHNHSGSCSSILLTYIADRFTYQFEFNDFPSETIRPVAYETGAPSSYNGAIWQPPRA